MRAIQRRGRLPYPSGAEEGATIRRSGSSGTTKARERSLLPFTWGLLLLFVLFTAVIGVREARAQISELTLAACANACGLAWRNAAATTTCGACLVAGGRWIHTHWLGEEPVGYGCAKAGVGC